jgi:hypothetical protein
MKMKLIVENGKRNIILTELKLPLEERATQLVF